MSLKQKVIVIGCGYWGKNLVRNFSQLGALGGVADINEDLAKQKAAEFNVHAYSIQEALDAKDAEGIVIATPAETHAKMAQAALKSGKHVFCEKPLAIDVKDAEKTAQVAKETGNILMVGHLLQYHPAFLKLKDILKDGTIGRLQYIYSHRMNFGKIRREENVLWSFAPHDISMILSLAGEEPNDVQAVGSKFLHEEIYDVTTTHLSFSNGIKAHIFVSWLHPFKEQKLVVIGDHGMLVFNDTLPWAEKLQLYPHKINWQNGMPVPDKADAQPIPLDESEPLKLECSHFLECIAEKKQPRTDGIEGLQVLKVLESAQKSLAKDKQNVSNATTNIFIHDTATVDDGVEIGANSKIWHYSHILGDVTIGKNCVIGQNVMIGPDVKVGANCKIQNNVSLYKGITLEDGVFCGPSCVFTNVINPRAEIERKDEFKETLIKKGTTIGANATILCGIELGSYSFIGAGAVVTKNVPDYALMVGNPAKQTGWMSRAGAKLDDNLVCPIEGIQYELASDGTLHQQNKKEKAA